MEFFTAWLSSLAGMSPVLVAWLAGIVLCLVFWRRCPTAALLAVIAFALLFVVTLIDSYLSMMFSLVYRHERGWSSAQLGTYFTIKAVVFSLLRAGAYGLLIPAIFGWRKER